MEDRKLNVLVIHYQNNSTDIPAPSTFTKLLQTQDLQLQQQVCDQQIIDPGRFDLIFIDVNQADWGEMLPDYVLSYALLSRVVLFNASQLGICEKIAIFAGIEGVFYQQDSPDIILKGIGSLIRNERWFKRSAMNGALQTLLKHTPLRLQSGKNECRDEVFDSLTKREKTIVSMLTGGAQNKEIADNLNISPNTVKTHLYSVFRKTKSRNRVELLAWVQRHIPVLSLN